MSIRPAALKWFKSKYSLEGEHVSTSKFFLPNESWTRRSTWWIQIPLKRIENISVMYFVCQIAPDQEDFHVLKVPGHFIRENLSKMVTINNKMVSLHLSAEPENLFVDERSKDNLEFNRFLEG